MHSFFHLYAFVFGTTIGSFLNVCIYRIPEGKSIVRPPSSCPKCGKGIRWFDNIPVVSWLLLAGKCRNCKVRIPFRYCFVEILTGTLATLLFWRFGLSSYTPVFFVLAAALVTITFIDIDHRIIPDVISLPGIAVGILLTGLFTLGFKAAFMGVLLGGGSLYAVAAGYALLAKREGMGGGDIKLLGMIGAFVGWQGVLFTIFAGSFAGTFIGSPSK